LAFFLDDMQRGDGVGALNVGVYVADCGAAGAWTRLGRSRTLLLLALHVVRSYVERI